MTVDEFDLALFQKNVWRLMRKRKVTVAYIASQIGYDAPKLRRVMTHGASRPPIAVVCALASFFEVSIEELVGLPVETAVLDKRVTDFLMKAENKHIKEVLQSLAYGGI